MLIAFDLDPSPLVTAITSRCVALAEHQQTTKDALAPCLPALTNDTAPLNAERVLVTKSVAALSDYLSVAGDVMVEENRKKFVPKTINSVHARFNTISQVFTLLAISSIFTGPC